jgi:uncharacterized protein DUF4271
VIRSIFLVSFQFAFNVFTLAQSDSSRVQQPDSVRLETKKNVINSTLKQDSLVIDSSTIQILTDTAWIAKALSYKNFAGQVFVQNIFFGFSSPPIAIRSDKKEFHGKELLFYTLIGLLLFFAFIRMSFPKYFLDLFRVAFRTTIKQRQISEQLVQAPLPSLLLNFFFLCTVGLYITLVLQHYHLASNYNFWLLYLYCFVALAVIYLIKFLSLKFFGWLFNITATADGYIFIVFMINKIIGIYVLPFLVLLAFSDADIYEAAFIFSYLGVFALLAYRFILSYGLVQNQIRLNPFHFFLYLCAFEIVPLLLIYKALLLWF